MEAAAAIRWWPVRPADRERGVALLTVLMLVAVVAVIAGASLERLRLATRLAGNAGAQGQAQNYARAAEALALSRLDGLLAQNPQRVTLAGGWSDRPFPLPLPNGLAIARVRDGGNCFNLNGLVTEVAPGVYQSDAAQRNRFARLMRLVDVPAQVAEQVAAGASDWIDTDTDVQTQGAEDASYAGLSPAYRTPGALMADPSELRAVAGVTPQVYAAIEPWVCTLPQARAATLNLNTVLPEQAPLIAALLPDSVAPGTIAQALLRRPPQGWSNAAAFWSGLSNSMASTDAQSATGVTSGWFALTVDVTVGTASLQERALIDATRLPSRLVSRQWGEK
jgi:general secretion pathway protein K